MAAFLSYPEYILSSEEKKNLGFISKLYFLIISIITIIIEKYTNYKLFTVLINLILQKEVKLSYFDGESIVDIFDSKRETRLSKIPFRFDNRGALIDNNIKLVVHDIKNLDFELYNLSNDPTESNDISLTEIDLLQKMKNEYIFWNKTVDLDVKKMKIIDPVQWRDADKYFPFFEEWIKRKEYSRYIKRQPYSVLFDNN